MPLKLSNGNKLLDLKVSNTTMSLLTTSNFNDFNSSKQYIFNVDQLPLLKIEASCPIGIFKGSVGMVIVEIDADEETLKDFQVNQTRNTINIVQHQLDSSGSVVFGNVVTNSSSFGTTVISGGENIQIVNGRVFINGQEVKEPRNTTKPHRLPKVKIIAPSSDLDATLSGDSLIVSEVPLINTFLSIGGSSKVGIPTESLELDISGVAEVHAVLGGGDLSIDASGSSSIDVQGCWATTKISLSGMGNIRTRGNCTGNYSVSASGMGSVSHVGTISGRVRKSVSGMAQIRV